MVDLASVATADSFYSHIVCLWLRLSNNREAICSLNKTCCSHLRSGKITSMKYIFS